MHNDISVALACYEEEKVASEKGIEALVRLLDQIPENPRIKRISENSFTMSIKDIGPDLVLSPAYHDFKAQKRMLQDKVKERSIQGALIFLKNAAKDGNIQVSTNYRVKMHPDVQKFLMDAFKKD